MMNEDKFREIVRRTILEQKSGDEESPKKKKKASKSLTKPGEIGVSVGRGAWSKQVQEAGALASENSDELMSRLGIDKTGSNLKGVMSIMRQAMENEIMGQAYGSITSVSKGDKQGLQVTPTGS